MVYSPSPEQATAHLLNQSATDSMYIAENDRLEQAIGADDYTYISTADAGASSRERR